MIYNSLPKATLFDLDGVLLDTEPVYTRIWEEIDNRYPTGVPDFALAIKGNTLPRILNEYFPDPKIQFRVVEMLHSKEDAMEYPIFDGVTDFLAELAKANVPCAIVTSSGDEKMNRIKQHNPEFMAFFSALITDSCVTHSKPHPEPYIKGAQALGVAPEDCWVFEDSFAGIKAGIDAGAAVIALATTNSAASLQNRGAKAIIDSFKNISPLTLIDIFNRQAEGLAIEP